MSKPARRCQDATTQLWILGDLVNYGPNPAEVVAYVGERAVHVVRGNHDHAAATRADPRCHRRYRDLAEATGRFTDSQLTATDREHLRGLPLELELELERTRFWLCHAIPSGPVYGYAQAGSPGGESRKLGPTQQCQWAGLLCRLGERKG
jgi:predicted phosphodiesterase